MAFRKDVTIYQRGNIEVIMPKGIRDFEWIQKAKVIAAIEMVLKCAKGGGFTCRKGFECWACSSKRKILYKLGVPRGKND